MDLATELKASTKKTQSQSDERAKKHHLEKTKADKLADMKKAKAVIAKLPSELKKHARESLERHYDVMKIEERYDYFKGTEGANDFSRLRGGARLVYIECKKLNLNPKIHSFQDDDGMGQDEHKCWTIRVSW